MKSVRQHLEQFGYAITDPVLDRHVIDDLLLLMKNVQTGDAVLERNGAVYGMRDLLNQAPGLTQFVQGESVTKLVSSLMGPNGRIVRAIFFDKTPEANWKVAWHQDCTIAVRERKEVTGFELWSMKAGIPHVRPPVEFLERMLTLRFHLDACDEDNGALKIIAGSHQHGRLPEKEVAALSKSETPVICNVAAGGVLAMKPLLVHASSAGTKPLHRRVLHFEFSADTLPGGLEWYDAV